MIGTSFSPSSGLEEVFNRLSSSKFFCSKSIGGKSKLEESLKSFSEIRAVTTKDDVQGKLKNRGIYCVLVGYSVYHANGVYEMLNFD
jgi:hypothetical protein